MKFGLLMRRMVLGSTLSTDLHNQQQKFLPTSEQVMVSAATAAFS